MTATTTTRRAVVIGTAEVTFTPYTIRKVGDVRQVIVDGLVQDVIYNPKRKLTYLVVNGVAGRIAAELVADCMYDTVVKGAKPVPAPVAPVAPVAAKPLADSRKKPAPKAKPAPRTKKAA